MDSIRQYLLSITAAAIVCTIGGVIVGNKGANASVIRLICGVIMALSVFSPLVKVRVGDFTEYANDFSLQANTVVSQAQSNALEKIGAIIKSQTEAYILDKAVSLKLDLEVEVTLNQANPPMPNGVRLSGAASAYAKEVLSNYISNDLGIPKEAQLWI